MASPIDVQDPWDDDDHDPWSDYNRVADDTVDRAAAAAMGETRRATHLEETREPLARRGGAQVYSMSTSSQEPPAQRIIHDVPPVWDGKDPDNEAEPFLKLLDGWLATTRTLKTQRGMTILHYSSGDLKTLINELSVDDLTSDESGLLVRKHVYNNYLEYLDKKLPKAMEKAIYEPTARRQKGET